MNEIRHCLFLATLTFLIIIECSENRQMEPFVVNGEFANIRDYPHCVVIFATCHQEWKCGASVLNQKILLTAAHCLFGCDVTGRIDAFAGHENFKKAKVKRRVKYMFIHEEYSAVTAVNDIGLALLEKNLPLGNSIKRVILTKQNNVGLSAVVAGWGRVNDAPNVDIRKVQTDVLKSAKQLVRTMNFCSKAGTIGPGMMCAGSFDSNQPRPSLGDSGSALITPKYRQLGIVSFCFVGYPSLMIYTNTSYYYDWIKNKSQILYCGN